MPDKLKTGDEMLIPRFFMSVIGAGEPSPWLLLFSLSSVSGIPAAAGSIHKR